MSEPDAPQEWTEPTPEQRAERAERANRATRGALAATLCLEALTILLVPRAIAQTSVGLGGAKTAVLVGLAVALVVIGFLLRRPWGIGVGSVAQLAVLATALWVHSFVVVAALFLGVWGFILHIRRQLVGTPSGWRMLVS